MCFSTPIKQQFPPLCPKKDRAHKACLEKAIVLNKGKETRICLYLYIDTWWLNFIVMQFPINLQSYKGNSLNVVPINTTKKTLQTKLGQDVKATHGDKLSTFLHAFAVGGSIQQQKCEGIFGHSESFHNHMCVYNHGGKTSTLLTRLSQTHTFTSKHKHSHLHTHKHYHIVYPNRHRRIKSVKYNLLWRTCLNPQTRKKMLYF